MSIGSDPRLVVCLHGLGRSPADWDAVASGLAPFGEVRTPALPRDPRDALGAAAAGVPEGAVVVAHSMGGIVALRLARERGRRYRALVLTDCFFPPARNGRGTMASIGDYASHRVSYLRELRSAAGGGAAGGSRAGQLTALAGLVRLGARRADFDAAAASVSAPVLVIHARDDHHVPVDFALAAAARHPSWDVRLLESGGHHPQVTNPDQWLVAAASWLESVGAG